MPFTKTAGRAIDYFVDLVVRVGTSPTANTEIRIYTLASYDGSTYPDVFDGTPSAETVTSAGVRDSFMKLEAERVDDLGPRGLHGRRRVHWPRGHATVADAGGPWHCSPR